MKKFGALLLAILMVLSLTGVAGATNPPTNNSNTSDAPTLGTGDILGESGTWETQDTPIQQDGNINIKKEIVAFNPNGTTVHAPVVTYTYTVKPATVGAETKVTDEATDHKSGTAVTAPVNSGLTTGLVVTGANAAGTEVAGSPGDDSEAVGTLVFDNTSTWTTAADGDANEYNINLDFTNVKFSQPGVYRYQIAETISANSYDAVAMKDGDFNTVYLDVYVDGSLSIYGYVCMRTNTSITPSGNTKINGFVNGGVDKDGTDKYYTYDLVLSKDVKNDTYAATNTTFPFSVIFTYPEDYTSTFTIKQTIGTGSTGLNSSAASLTGLPTEWSGVVLVKDGDKTEGTTVGNITLTGIPAGVDVEVYETNTATGTTYTVSTSVTGGIAVIDNNVSSTSTTPAATAQTTKAAYESTKATVNTEKIATTVAQSVAITNELLLISPTGVVLRIAPYAMILAAGIALLLISRRRTATVDED